MVTHQNPSISERALRILNTKMGNHLPDEVAGPVAVIPLSPIVRIVKSANRTTNGASTVYTTPSDKDFYLTGVQMDTYADATSDVTEQWLGGYIDAVQIRIVSHRKPTTTARSQNTAITFPFPIKIDRGTVLSITQTSTAGAATTQCQIYGYTEEVTRT